MRRTAPKSYLPPLGRCVVVLITGIVFAVSGPDWLFLVWRVGTALWLCTYLADAVDAALGGHDGEKANR